MHIVVVFACFLVTWPWYSKTWVYDVPNLMSIEICLYRVDLKTYYSYMRPLIFDHWVLVWSWVASTIWSSKWIEYYENTKLHLKVHKVGRLRMLLFLVSVHLHVMIWWINFAIVLGILKNCSFWNKIIIVVVSLLKS